MPVFDKKTISFYDKLFNQQDQEYHNVPQVYDKDAKDFRSSIKFNIEFDPTTVVAIAVHADAGRNMKTKIKCHHSIPLPGYKYNTVNDTCSVTCYDFLCLGTVGISYRAKIQGTAGWEFRIPMPVDVIKRYLNHDQRKAYKEFQDRFKAEGDVITFEFLQMISAF
jgi:hypothetical protein